MNCELSPIPVMLKSPFRGLGDCPFLGVGTARSNLPAILPLFCYHPHFQYHAILLAATPHTLKRQEAAISGKKWQYYTTQSGHGARITHRTPVLCVTMCNWVQVVEKNLRSLCKSVQ